MLDDITPYGFITTPIYTFRDYLANTSVFQNWINDKLGDVYEELSEEEKIIEAKNRIFVGGETDELKFKDYPNAILFIDTPIIYKKHAEYIQHGIVNGNIICYIACEYDPTVMSIDEALVKFTGYKDDEIKYGVIPLVEEICSKAWSDGWMLNNIMIDDIGISSNEESADEFKYYLLATLIINFGIK